MAEKIKEKTNLNEAQLERKRIILQCLSKQMTTMEAALTMNLTQRAVQYNLARYARLGDACFIHGNTGKKRDDKFWTFFKTQESTARIRLRELATLISRSFLKRVTESSVPKAGSRKRSTAWAIKRRTNTGPKKRKSRTCSDRQKSTSASLSKRTERPTTGSATATCIAYKDLSTTRQEYL